MARIAIVGSGITGVTSAYALACSGHQITVFDRHRYPAMETSFANGGQLSASNAEVWNSWSTIAKGFRWMLSPAAPLLINPRPSWHKYSWLAEFCGEVRNYRRNTAETVRLAIAARDHLFRWASSEQIDFDLERRGILHIYHDRESFLVAERSNGLLMQSGLDRHAVGPEEMRSLEPTLSGDFFGGFYTPSDSTGDIHKFTRGLAQACERRGVAFSQGASVERIVPESGAARLVLASGEDPEFDAVVVCAGAWSRALAAPLGDRINIYPVKGYSITVHLADEASRLATPSISLLDERAKIVTSRLGTSRFRVAGTAEFNGFNKDIRDDRIAPLTQWVQRLFPGIATDTVVPWAGLRPMTPSMLPVVKRSKRPRVFYNTGHGHLGWTLSAATAELLRGHVDSLHAN